MRDAFIESIRTNQSVFGIELPDAVIEKLAAYFDVIQEHNLLLHLVAPCSAEEFATRHILESLTLLRYLPEHSRFADVGTGAGLPSIPCLIAREDLTATLIESKEKKTEFLKIAVDHCGIADRTEIVNRQFSETSAGEARFVVCRALDKFVDKLPQLLKWAGDRELLLFGGPTLSEGLDRAKRTYASQLMPQSERRYLFVVKARRRR